MMLGDILLTAPTAASSSQKVVPVPPKKWLTSHNYIFMYVFMFMLALKVGMGKNFYAGVKTGGGATGMSAPGLPVVLIGRGG
jgi:hypothetical protein